jgi:hypothetical protein
MQARRQAAREQVSQIEESPRRRRVRHLRTSGENVQHLNLVRDFKFLYIFT